MKCGESEIFQVNRTEGSFDRASDEAYRRAVHILGIDEDGHSSKVDDWQRSACWIEVEFVRYVRTGGMGGQNHEYTFRVTPRNADAE